MLKVKLLQDIDLQSKKGAVIEVAAGYARNYLIKNGFAEEVREHVAHEWDPKEMSETESVDLQLVLKEFRRQMYQNGVRKWSINGLNRVFDSLATDCNGMLVEWQFTEAINKFGVFLNVRAMQTLFRAFDRDNSGSINYQEFVSGLRGPMNERRYAIVEKAWKKVQANPGESSFASNNPLVLAGKATEGEIAAHVLPSNTDDKEAFFKHYTDVSAVIDSDDMFVTMIEKQHRVVEGNDDDAMNRAVQEFRVKLLDKLHQKSFQGASQSRTLYRAFQLVSSSSSGVTRGEFMDAMETFGFHGKLVDTVFDYFDANQNHVISYDEFSKVMLS